MRINIKQTLERLLAQEDIDGDKKITIEDSGPKSFLLSDDSGEELWVNGTYQLSNLLQELVLAQREGAEEWDVQSNRIDEPPVDRISRMIRDYYWKGLTRRMDASGIEKLLSDTKNEVLEAETTLRIYVPATDDFALEYYRGLQANLPIEVIQLPEDISPEYVRSINEEPGILSLRLDKVNDQIQGRPFVVPGGRFNEMYGWDSYFEAVGLMVDGKVELAQAMADNFQYQIQHYGKILNANRSYYLTRTQPPFYSSLIREVYEIIQDKQWLSSHLETAIQEYETVWMEQGKRLTANGLNRYLAQGLGKTPEAEEGHYTAIFTEFAQKEGADPSAFEAAYYSGELQHEGLDAYFVHDRSVRESGHDTSNRLEGICADLNVVELNALLYKYEMDFAFLIEAAFEDNFNVGGNQYTSEFWQQKASERKTRVDAFLWNEQKEFYFDFNFNTQEQIYFYSATAFVPLWAGMASQDQAQKVVDLGVRLLKEKGGIASCTLESRGPVSEHRPQRQWDYPNGWAPHQMMIWKGMFDYGFQDQAQELIYRWLYMITRNAVDYNGTIPEKYDVVAATHKVFAEYGNVGTQFEYITQEGFGWMNASYQYGLSLLQRKYREALNALKTPESLFNS